VILCNARAMGEFGAVSVVSGHIRGKTNTVPLQVEILYNEYNFVAAFAVASLLALLALVTLAAQGVHRMADGADLAGSARSSGRTSREHHRIQDISKSFGAFQALRGVSLEIPDGELGAARPQRLGQDDAAAHHRGLEFARPGQRAHPLRRRTWPAAACASARGLRVPALRAVQAHDGVREREPSGCACGRSTSARNEARSRKRA
jgi:hypothetical protein